VHSQETCIDCGKLSPPTNTDNTLTSSFGWRMLRKATDHGEMFNEWRCATCWSRYKTLKGLSRSGETSSYPPPSSSARKKPDDRG
jgi:hypothetical protein